MKILAIRGEGLASLARRFELALDAAPLRDAGVFAIVGPTGAGKSTLLDALCVALYDRTPRLTGRGERIGTEEDARAAGDPRNLLRRGAGRGHAEVDFRGIDGRVYRARWEVRRARGQADGRLQDTTMSLVDVETGRAVSGTRKGEVLAAIEERLGLSFAQFQRAVLLAQGRFAAFLEADDRDRAELLERMTGTEIYGRISIEVARRAREERSALERLEEGLAYVAPMSDDARRAQEASLPERTLEVARAAQRARTLEAQARWWTERDLWAREEAESRRELAELDGQLDLSEARRRDIEEAQRAEPLRAPLEALDRAEQVGRGARAAKVNADAVAASAERERGEATEALARAEMQEREARARADALSPVLREARALDRELAVARAKMGEAAARAARAAEVSTARGAERVAHGGRIATLHRQIESATGRRRAEGALDTIAEDDAPRLIERLERLVALRDSARDAAERRARVAAQTAPRRRALEEAIVDAQRWRAALEAAGERLAARRDALARELGAHELRDALERLGAARSALAVIGDAARRASVAAARAATARASERAARLAIERGEARRAEALSALPSARARLLEAERARDLATAMLDLAQLRSELRDGDACPLCGALDHPYARHAPVALVDAQRARVAELRDEVVALERALATADAEIGSERVASERAAEAAVASEREATEETQRAREASRARALESLASWWSGAGMRLRARLAPAEDVHAAGAGGAGGAPIWAEARDRSLDEAAVEAWSRGVEEARARVLAALAAREAAERAVEGASQERDRAASGLAQVERAARDAESALEAVGRAVAEHEREHARALADLEESAARIATWRAAIEARVGPLEALDRAALAEVQRALATCAEARRDEARARSALAALEADAARAADAEAAAKRDEEDARTALARAEEEVAALASRRSAIAADDLDALEESARIGCDAGRAMRESAAQHRARTETALAAALEAVSSAARANVESTRELVAARTRLEDALRTSGLEEAALRRLLARPREELAAWRRELAVLDERRARGHAVLDERVRRREAHDAAPPDGLLPRDAIERELARARDAENVERRLLASLEDALARDDRQRAERAEIVARIEAQRVRVGTWATLETLIGSADGKRFRVFAQGLTLELLLDHANAQLERLAPRYALRRTPGAELGVQVVDREMGDEIRGIKSLSGGETFLVSLALALALASMTARRVPVDSLFIDEGFGGLDAESLEVVLAALDALQASGRQVGVVSHVAAMAERFAARVEVRPAGHAESLVEVVS
ncbi:AAA family ATPase [Sandaracinus amylolyticus]|uniref:AAA family ATPase n=1 Tax=Sandaracinus amylolyticus TaxID=927083 RepID=UPI001F2DA4E0|nr:AAA family ATPase [Sandaracinus amylolyticus]UJR79140.1 Nuclease SbcCD subunit C [Sandaracinus amylolyticus]